MRNIIKVLLFKFCVSSSAQSTYVCRERDIRYFDLSILEPIRPNRGHLIHQYERKSNKIINMTNVVLFIAKQFGLLWTCFPAISVEYHYIMWCLYNIKRFEGSKLCQNGDRMLKNMCSAARRTCFWLGGGANYKDSKKKKKNTYKNRDLCLVYSRSDISIWALLD
jgi:hypothetical protein